MTRLHGVQYVNFVVAVLGELEATPLEKEEQQETLPQWAIAVVVIGLASLAFVVIFGVSMVSTL